MDRAKLVSLSTIFDLDPSIAEIADLRLGLSAARAAVGAPRQRSAAFPSDWDALLEQAEAHTHACQQRLERDFDLADWHDLAQAGLVVSSLQLRSVQRRATPGRVEFQDHDLDEFRRLRVAVVPK